MRQSDTRLRGKIAVFAAALLALTSAAWAGPVFDGVTLKTAPLPGPSATLTHRGDGDSTPSASVSFSNGGGDLSINAPPPPSRYSATLFGGADSSGGVGDIGHYTDPADVGYGVVGYPSAMGVSQTDAPGGTFNPAGAASLKETFNLRWNVTGSWIPSLFAYQLFPLAFHFTNPGDSASFVGNFTYEIDDDANGVPNTVRTININVARSFADGTDVFVVAYAFAFLRRTAVPAGAIVRVKGDVTFTALDPLGNVSVELHDNPVIDPELQSYFDLFNLPIPLQDKHGGGVFMSLTTSPDYVCATGMGCSVSPITPEPAAGLMPLIGAGALALHRRR